MVGRATPSLSSRDTQLALTATIYHFNIDLAHNDRQVYESLALRVARHPSESEEFLWTRVLAYALEYKEGIEFSRAGLSEPEEPAIVVRDLTGGIRSWIEIGTPDPSRLHKASKAAPRVAVYLHKDPAQFLSRLGGERIHQASAIEIWAIDRQLLSDMILRLDRRMSFSVSVTDHELYICVGSDTLSGLVTRHAIPSR